MPWAFRFGHVRPASTDGSRALTSRASSGSPETTVGIATREALEQVGDLGRRAAAP